jgi:hypothetical protein
MTHPKVRRSLPCQEAAGFFNSSVFALLPINILPKIGNRKIHEDLGSLYFADHIRARTESFDSKLGCVGNSLFRQLGRYLR